MKEIIEQAIRDWLAKYNYLFSKNEISDLAAMIEEGFDDGENCRGCVFKDFHEQNYPTGE